MEWSRLRPKDRFPKTHTTKTFQRDQPKEGVFHERPKAPPKNPVWSPKTVMLEDESLFDTPPESSKAREKPSPKTTKPKKPQPRPHPKKPTYHYESAREMGTLRSFASGGSRLRGLRESELSRSSSTSRVGDRESLGVRRGEMPGHDV